MSHAAAASAKARQLLPGEHAGHRARRVSRRRSAHGDLRRERERRHELDPVAAPEPTGVVPARRPPRGQQSHVLVRRRHEFRAVDRLERRGAAADPAGDPLPGQAAASSGTFGRRSGRSPASAGPRGGARSALELAHPRPLAVALVPRRTASASRCSWTPRWRSPVHTSASERPSSACHSSGGRSSIATTMPTWLTGLFVTVWIARSASDGRGTARGRRSPRWRRRRRAQLAEPRTSVTYATDARPLEAGRPGGHRRRRRHRRCRRAQAPGSARLRPRRAARAAARPARGRW